MSDDLILELRGGVYDGYEAPIFPPDVAERLPADAVVRLRAAVVRAYAPCPWCGSRHDLWLPLPPHPMATPFDAAVATIPATGVNPRQPAARYAFLEAHAERVVYEYRNSAEAVWLAARPPGVDPCRWDPSR